MSAIEFILLAVGAIGLAVILDGLPWFRRVPLSTRLRPYAPPASAGSSGRAADRSTWHAVFRPVAEHWGDRLSRLLGVNDDLAVRLARARSDMDVGSFRMRQLVHAIVGLGGGAAIALVISPGPVVSCALILGAPTLWMLADEQFLSSRSARRTHRLELELPVVAEQLGILLSGGWSLPAAINRIGARGRGAVAEDLRDVGRHIRHGLSETAALTQWSDVSGCEGVRRLVAVLALHREAGDLGLLISAEARAIRAASHRSLIETLERRAQLVWVPVTVATLVPGLVFLAVPFISAMSKISGGP